MHIYGCLAIWNFSSRVQLDISQVSAASDVPAADWLSQTHVKNYLNLYVFEKKKGVAMPR